MSAPAQVLHLDLGEDRSVVESGTPLVTLPAPVVLGLAEGRRILLHPVSVLSVLVMVGVVLDQRTDGPREAFELLSSMPTWFQGVATYFAAHLVATRDRRASSGELLAALPVTAVGRTWAMVVAALVPAGCCAAFVAAVHALNTSQDLYAVPPDVWHLAQAPLTVLGAALLGLMVARCTAVPGVALLVMVAMVLADAWLNARPLTLQPLGTFVAWPVWGDPGQGWTGMNPGSPAWHVAYLASLCTMAGAGAFLRVARRTWLVLLVGGAATACAVVTGLLQLP